MRYRAVFALVGHDVVQPFAQKIAAVVQIAGSRGKHLCIARPAKPLVALRTIRRHFDEVGALRPDRVFDQAIDQRMAGHEAAVGVVPNVIGTEAIEIISAFPSTVTRA